MVDSGQASTAYWKIFLKKTQQELYTYEWNNCIVLNKLGFREETDRHKFVQYMCVSNCFVQ